MLSFHAPHNLYAEISLMAIGLCVFAYRFCGSNEWLKTHGDETLGALCIGLIF